MTTIDAPTRIIWNRGPQDDDELWWTVFALWGVKVPRTKVCPGHVAPFTAFANAYFARDPLAIWHASRGFGGKSKTLATLTQTEAVLLGAEASILGGSAAQSLNVHQHTQEAWHHFNAPKALLLKEPTKWDTYLTNGAHMRSLTASQTSVRGPHPQRLRLDEIDEMDLEILNAAQGQPMRKRNRSGDMIETQTVLSSTWQYPDKTMAHMMKEARDRGWPIYQWCWKESANPTDGWLALDEVERQRSLIPAHMWEAEYDLQEPSFEGRAFDTDSVDAVFAIHIGEFSGDEPVVVSKPVPSMPYLTAIDWAKEKDQTIVATFQTYELPWKCVAWRKMNRMPWPLMIRKAIEQWQTYGGDLVHDQTGIGNVVHDDIKEIVTPEEFRRVTGIVMSGGRERHNMFSEYISAVEHLDVLYPRINYAYNEHRYCTIDDLYGRGHPPDTVVAGALAWSRRKLRHQGAAGPIGGVRTSAWQM